MHKAKSRKRTPWDGASDVTETQEFPRQNYDLYYADRHRMVGDSGEAGMINSYIPTRCPYCAKE